MATAREESCEKSVSSQFEWRIPQFQLFLLQHQSVRESRPHAFCGGDWVFRFMKKNDAVALFINRREETNHHTNYLEWKLMIIDNEETEYLFSECKWTYRKGESTYYGLFDEGRLSSIGGGTGFDVKIICLFKCFRCIPLLSKRFDGLDLMDLFISGEDSDVTIHVQDREFRVHKCIIRSRSPVFFSMFSHDMLESNSGRVDITDCDAEAFQTFLEYIYSGKLNCSQDVVQHLYYITDKYQVTKVKAECAKFMSENLSVENFCDTVTLSLRHEELALLESAQKFYARNSKAVVRTAQWLSFLKEESTAANDFFAKLPGREDSSRE